MTSEALEFEQLDVEIDGGVATITLNRPEKLNAISEGMRDELDRALAALNPGDAVRVIRIRGAGRAFSSGYDMTAGYEREAPPQAPRIPDASGRIPLAGHGEARISGDRDYLRTSIERWLRIWGYRKPLIAQVHGVCFSGALDLMGVCDLAFAATGTRFGHPASRVNGIPVTLGMLPMKIGASATKQLLFTGDEIDAAEAWRIGMIDRVVDPDELDDHTMAFCRRVAELPLDALTVHKHVTNRWMEVMNIRLAALEGAEFDAIFHETPAKAEFFRIAREDGLRAALAWRDQPPES
jgi:enoyl-CoA hydratase